MSSHSTKSIHDLVASSLCREGNSIQILPIGGGSINETFKVVTGEKEKYFVKRNSTATLPGLFQKEKNGLNFLRKQDIIAIPQILVLEVMEDEQILVIEWIQTGERTEKFWKNFGYQLALLHQVSQEQFGFAENNYMGALEQSNHFSNGWVDFFTHRRLEPQIKLAEKQKLLSSSHINSFQILFKRLDTIFIEEDPALLHGDLWSGNFMCNEKEMPVLIDPAVYFGHRSIDLGMTTLFGGFSQLFYDSYNYHFPFPDNYREQWEVCNLYPLLIHLNLFGVSYLNSITSTLKGFL